MNGHALSTEAAPLVSEYFLRHRLAKLGFTSDLAYLSAYKAEAFCLIDVEIEEAQAREAKKRGKREHG